MHAELEPFAREGLPLLLALAGASVSPLICSTRFQISRIAFPVCSSLPSTKSATTSKTIEGYEIDSAQFGETAVPRYLLHDLPIGPKYGPFCLQVFH